MNHCFSFNAGARRGLHGRLPRLVGYQSRPGAQILPGDGRGDDRNLLGARAAGPEPGPQSFREMLQDVVSLWTDTVESEPRIQAPA